MTYKNLYIFLFLILSLGNTVYSQYLVNGTLKGSVGNHPPDSWISCDDWSDPDIWTKYVTYNDTNNVYYPVNGCSTLVVLRSRGEYFKDTTMHPKLTCEYMAQRLEKPFENNACFRFSGFLCYNRSMFVNDSFESNVVYPLKLEVWGGNSDCTKEKLLFSTEAISNTSWKKYNYDFSITDSSYSYIILQTAWDLRKVKNIPYNGMIMLDSLNLIKLKDVDTIKTDTIYYKGDGKTTLTAGSAGDTYEWYPDENLLPKNTQSTTMQ